MLIVQTKHPVFLGWICCLMFLFNNMGNVDMWTIQQLDKEETTSKVKALWRSSKRSCPYLFCGEQGLVRYWHIGNSRNAKAMVARTVRQKGGREGEITTQSYASVARVHVNRVSVWVRMRSVCLCGCTCSAYGEHHLNRVEEEEHDEQRHRSSDGQKQCLRGVYGLNTWEDIKVWATHYSCLYTYYRISKKKMKTYLNNQDLFHNFIMSLHFLHIACWVSTSFLRVVVEIQLPLNCNCHNTS